MFFQKNIKGKMIKYVKWKLENKFLVDKRVQNKILKYEL